MSFPIEKMQVNSSSSAAAASSSSSSLDSEMAVSAPQNSSFFQKREVGLSFQEEKDRENNVIELRTRPTNCIDEESLDDKAEREDKERFLDSHVHFTLVEILKNDEHHVRLYWLACLFGFFWIYDKSGKFNIFLCIWNIILVLGSLIGLGFFIYFIAALHGPKYLKSAIGCVLQYIFNAFIVYSMRRVFTHKLSILKMDDWKEQSENIMNYSFICGFIFLVVQVILLLLALGLTTVFGNTILLFCGISFIPLAIFLSGMLTVAVADLKFTYLYVNHIVKQLEDLSITEERYYHVKAQLQEKEKTSPVDLILIMGVIGLSFCLIAIQETSQILFFCAILLRNLAAMVPVVYEIVKVNDLTGKMTEIIRDKKWSKPALCSTRNGIYMAIKESPMTCTILKQQPTTAEIYGTLIGMIVSVVASIVMSQLSSVD